MRMEGERGDPGRALFYGGGFHNRDGKDFGFGTNIGDSEKLR